MLLSGNMAMPWWIFFIGAFLLYANTLLHTYALDDYLIIVNNELVQAGWSKIGELVTAPFTWGAGFNDGLYRPLTLLSFASEVAIFGPDQPLLSHLINVGLFAALCVFLFQLLQQWWPKLPVIWVAVAVGLYLVHPIHTEVVANIKSRDELLGFFFVISSALGAHHFWRERKIGWGLWSVLSFGLALLSKESTIVFLLVLPLAYGLLQKKSIQDQLPILLGYIAVSGLFLWLRHMALEVWYPGVDYSRAYNELSNSLEPTTGLTRFGMSSLLVGKYLWKCLFPWHLGYEYSFNQIPVRPWTDPLVLLSILANLALVSLMVKGLFQRKLYGFALLFFYATVALFSNLLFIIGVTFAERFAFVPSLAICLLLAYLLERWASKGKTQQVWALSVAGLLIALFAVRTVVRNPVWKDNESLFLSDVRQVPNSAKAQYNAGTQYGDMARARGEGERAILMGQAIQHFEKAISLFADYPDAQNNLANIYLEQGELNQALGLFDQVLLRYPRHRKGHYNRAVTLYQLERYAEAAGGFRTYLDFSGYNLSNQAQAHYFLGMSLGFTGQFDQSIVALNEALRLNPNYWEAHLAVGKAYGLQRNFEASSRHLQEVLRIVPNEVESQVNLAITYMNLGRFKEATSLLQQAIQNQPDHPQARSLLQNAEAQLAAGGT